MLLPYAFRDLNDNQTTPLVAEDFFEELDLAPQEAEWTSLPVRSLRPPVAPPPPPRVEAPPPPRVEAAPGPGPRSPEPDPAELARIRKQARDAGHAEGVAKGWEEGIRLAREEVSRQHSSQEKELANLLETLRSAQTQLFESIKEDLLGLLVKVPERIVRQELAIDPGRVRGVLEALLKELPRCRRMVVRAHPDDAELLQITGADRDTPIEVRVDPSLGRGDLKLETDRGTVDATIETQLARWSQEAAAWLAGEHGMVTTPREAR